jgi:hypothetical protein
VPLRSFILSAPSINASNDVTADNPGGQHQVFIKETTLDGSEIAVPPYGLVVLLPADAPTPRFTTWEGLHAGSTASVGG